MDPNVLDDDVANVAYKPQFLLENYNIPHPQRLCISGNLSYQPPPPPAIKELKVLQTFPEILANEKVSGAQIEGAILALNKFLQRGKGEAQLGFYLGDQAGTGKSRIIALLIHELCLRGQKKAVWISITKELLKDAHNELMAVKFDCKNHFFAYVSSEEEKKKTEAAFENNEDGVIFTTYSHLKSGENYKNLLSVVKWLGPFFEGLIVFDESHVARNETQASRLVKWLQETFKLARILYVTATAGTKPSHLSYMTRLGLWGPGAPFKNVLDFESKTETRGLAAMELISNHLVKTGSYISRQLDLQNVVYESYEIQLDERQKGTYNACCRLWQALYELLQENYANASIPVKKSDVKMLYKEYWCAHQRFFNALLLTMKSGILREIRRQNKDKSIVVSLQSTGQEPLKKLKYPKNVSRRYSLCRTMLEQILAKFNIFPSGENISSCKVESQAEVVEFHFNMVCNYLGPNPIDEMIHALGGRKKVAEITGRTYRQVKAPKVPEPPDTYICNPIGNGNKLLIKNLSDRNKQHCHSEDESDTENDEIDDTNIENKTLSNENDINEDKTDSSSDESDFSTDDKDIEETDENIGNVDLSHNPQPKKLFQYTIDRSKINIKEEVENFMNGRKKSCIISQKGSTGISLHSSWAHQNRRQRLQVIVQFPWVPEQAIQQLGRTNRTNQKFPPKYLALTTDVPGEARFFVTFVDRLQKMGAICQGERRASNQMSDALNVPFTESAAAANFCMKDVVNDIFIQQEYENIAVEFKRCAITQKKLIDLEQFFNRMLGMTLNVQREVIDKITKLYLNVVAELKAQNKFEPKMKSFSPKWILAVGKTYSYGEKDEGCQLLKIIADRGLPWEYLLVSKNDLFEKQQREPKFFVSDSKVACCYPSRYLKLFGEENGEVYTYLVYTPWNCELVQKHADIFKKGWTELSFEANKEHLETLWTNMYRAGVLNKCLHSLSKMSNCRANCTEGARKFTFWILKGALLKVWDIVCDVFSPPSKKDTPDSTPMQTLRLDVHVSSETKEKIVAIYVPDEKAKPLHSRLKQFYLQNIAIDVTREDKTSKNELKQINRAFAEFVHENKTFEYLLDDDEEYSSFEENTRSKEEEVEDDESEENLEENESEEEEEDEEEEEEEEEEKEESENESEEESKEEDTEEESEEEEEEEPHYKKQKFN